MVSEFTKKINSDFCCYKTVNLYNEILKKLNIAMKSKILNLILLFSLSFTMFAQNTSAPKFSAEDSSAINALSLYPDSIRLNIFEACQYPEILVRLAMNKEKSAASFKEIISTTDRKAQEELWNLCRYPELISALAVSEKSESEIDRITERYPSEIRQYANKYGRNNRTLLKRIDSLNTETNRSFETLLEGYPEKTVRAYRELLFFPEVLSILNDHLDIAVMAGAGYKRNPERVIHFADSVSLAAARQNAEELSQWKDSVMKDTNNINDLKVLAKEFSTENKSNEDELRSPSSTTTVILQYAYYPYPYWYGYPYWYPEPYWYPVPLWMDLGFYYDPFGHIVFIGMPSYRFVHWYFYHPHHWHHHPYIGHTFVSHYYGHRQSPGSNSAVVHKWVEDNDKFIPRDFIKNRSNGIETMRELGQLNTIKDPKGNSLNNIQREEYYEKNRSEYPGLHKNTDVVKTGETRIEINKNPVRDRETENKTDTKKTETYDKIQKAQDYHREEWDRASPRTKPPVRMNETFPKEKVQPKMTVPPKRKEIPKSPSPDLPPVKSNPQTKPDKRK